MCPAVFAFDLEIEVAVLIELGERFEEARPAVMDFAVVIENEDHPAGSAGLIVSQHRPHGELSFIGRNRAARLA